MKFEYYCVELDSGADRREINAALFDISKKGHELVTVTIHPARKTIMLFAKAPWS